MVCWNLQLKKYSKLFVDRQLTWFLDDKNGKVEAIEMICLKPKVGTGTILEDTTDPLPNIRMFKVCDAIAALFKFQSIVDHFQEISKLDKCILIDILLQTFKGLQIPKFVF